MQLHRPLALLAPTLEADVLQVLAGADAAFTGRQVARMIPDASQKGVLDTLKRLLDQGIVFRDVVGSAHNWRLNRSHLAAPYVLALSRLGTEFAERVGKAVASWEIQPVYVAIFGSGARCEMRPDSDIDLFIVRPDEMEDEDGWFGESEDLASMASQWTGNDVRILEMSQSEVEDGLVRGDRVLVDILADGRVVFGPSRWLHGLARGRNVGS